LPTALGSLLYVWFAPGVGAQAPSSKSAPAAIELAALMTERKLDAYAARSPEAADAFVAALLFPQVQLLVVTGKPTAPAAVEAQLTGNRYSDVYALLHQSVVPESKFFVQDLKADGLHARAPDTVDVVYDRVVTQMVFDGSPSKRRLNDGQYDQQFVGADTRYARLLMALIDGLKQTQTSPGDWDR
jgi:hypothetical protein